MLDHLLATPKGLCLVYNRNFRSSPSPLQEIHRDYGAARGRVGAKISFETLVLLMRSGSKETRAGWSTASVAKVGTEGRPQDASCFQHLPQACKFKPSQLAGPVNLGWGLLCSLICVALQGRCGDLLRCL